MEALLEQYFGSETLPATELLEEAIQKRLTRFMEMYEMALELLCGVKANDKVDVFSFGCVVSEIFSRVICYSDSCDLSSQSVQMVFV